MMDQGLLTIIEVLLRIALGLRILYSGVSNVLRWPHAVGTARIIFPKGATFFALVGVALMVLGGTGVTLGLRTQIAAFMIVIFLMPTFKIQWQRLRTLPGALEKVMSAVAEKEPRDGVRQLGRHAIHAYEIGWQNNLVLLLVALFFSLRGSVAFGLDNLFK